jgi:endonuclease YncB( thermonuclease family)
MKLAILFVTISFATCGTALADPCEAPVTGYKAGQTVSGQVRYVGDGDSLCIGNSANPRTWIEIRIADFYAPELREPGGEAAKRALTKIAKGSQVVCRVEAGRNGRTSSYDRLIAVCRMNGRSLGQSMRDAGIREAGRGRRALRQEFVGQIL